MGEKDNVVYADNNANRGYNMINWYAFTIAAIFGGVVTGLFIWWFVSFVKREL